jgi:hypothetical protein
MADSSDADFAETPTRLEKPEAVRASVLISTGHTPKELRQTIEERVALMSGREAGHLVAVPSDLERYVDKSRPPRLQGHRQGHGDAQGDRAVRLPILDNRHSISAKIKLYVLEGCWRRTPRRIESDALPARLLGPGCK